MKTSQKPLMLKDFLELDANSDSCNSFQCVPTSIRFLLEVELGGGGDRSRGLPPRSRSKSSTITKISAAINNAVKNLPISSPTRIRPKARARAEAEAEAEAKPMTALRKLLGRSFWRRRSDKEEEEEVDKVPRVKDIVRLNSFELYGERRSSVNCPSPVASSCSSCSGGASDNNSSSSSSSSSASVSDSLLSSHGSLFDCSGAGETKRIQSPKRTIVHVHENLVSGRPHKSEEEEEEEENKEGGGCQIEPKEKEQLSPASVIDFPFQDEEDKDDDEDDSNNETVSSPRFEQNLANIERTRHQLLEKIKRFECLADLDSLDLLESFTNFEELVSTEDEEEIEIEIEIEDEEEDEDFIVSSLIRRLGSVGPHKKLLYDFFHEELTRTTDLEGLFTAAEHCIQGKGHLTAEDHGKAQIGEMERNGRWRCFEDDKKVVATEVEVRMLGSLLEELVLDLTYGQCHI